MYPTITIRPARELGMNPGAFVFYVVTLPGGKVRVSQYADGLHGPTMPAASLPHFVNDLEGRVDGPKSRVPAIEAVIRGDAALCGKGDDGIVFRVGREIVKVSTTVPFQPMNAGHLSPAQAIDRLRKQTEIHNRIAAMGFADPAKFYKHGDKGFQIRPYLTIPKKFTRAQLDALQDALIAIHDRGLATYDEIQAGLDSKGRVKFFDLGKTEPVTSSFERYDGRSPYSYDLDRLRRLYEASGAKYVDRDPVRRKLTLERERRMRR